MIRLAEQMVLTALSLTVIPALGAVLLALSFGYDNGTYRRSASGKILRLIASRSRDEWEALTELQRINLSDTERWLTKYAMEETQDFSHLVGVLAVGPKSQPLAKTLRKRATKMEREASADLDALLVRLTTEPLMRAQRLAARSVTRARIRMHLAALRDLAPRTGKRLGAVWALHTLALSLL